MPFLVAWRRSGGLRWSWHPLKICRRGQSMFWPQKMSRSFIRNCCCITRKVSHHQKWKTCVKNIKYLIFFSRRIQVVRNWDCWVFGNHWHRKQFDGLTWLAPTPPDFKTDLHHCLAEIIRLTWRSCDLNLFTLRAKLSGAVYCYRSCLWLGCLQRADGRCPNLTTTVFASLWALFPFIYESLNSVPFVVGGRAIYRRKKFSPL